MARSEAKITTPGEKLPTHKINPNRFVIYGSRLSGAYKISEELSRFLLEKGIENPDVEVVRDAGYINQRFYLEPEGKRTKKTPPKLPRGVILLDEMRQYFQGKGMTLDTTSSGIRDYVETLCRENGIPLIMFTGDFSVEFFEQSLRELAETNPRQLPDNGTS